MRKILSDRMYTHPVIELLKTFTEKELMRFLKFLNSPYFNNRRMMVKLFKTLRTYYPEFESKNFTKHHLYKRIYGKAAYNDSTFRNLMSDLLKFIQQFLKLEATEKNEVESQFFLTTELINRGEYNLFRNKIEKMEKSVIESNTMDGDYFMNLYRINTDAFYINLLTKKVLKKNFVLSESEKMINGIIYIMMYFILETIKHNDNLLKYSRAYNIKKNFDTVSQFLEIFNFKRMIDYVDNNSGIKLPIIEVYYNLLKTFTFFEDEKYYFEFKNSLLNVSGKLGANDNHFLHTRLIDYCIVKKNTGAECSFDLDREIFDLNKIYVRNEAYRSGSNVYIPFDYFRNVLINCITVKELRYMEEFIKDNTKKLIPKHVHSVENYSHALLYFEKKNYPKAQALLNKIKFDQFVYKLDMKNLQLKLSYELGQFESAISMIDTYKHFLKNNALISESRRTLHNNFINFANMLIQLKNGKPKFTKQFLADKIEKTKNVFDKVWLKDKIKELK